MSSIIYFRELRAHRKSLLFWSLAMIFLVVSGVAKFNGYQADSEAMSALINQMPHTLQVIFGLSGFDLSSVKGYYGALYLYMIITVAVHAVLLGAELISKEERDRTAEFLLVRPQRRSQIVTAKLLAGLTSLLILNAVTFLSSVLAVYIYSKDTPITGYIALLMAGMLALQLIFFSFGSFVAAYGKKPKASSTIAATVLLGLVLLMYLINFNDKLHSLSILTPFKYFEANTILSTNSLNNGYLLASAVIVIVCTFLTYRSYTKRDITI